MVDNNSHENGSGPGGIEKILLERERLEKVLQDEYRKEVTIMLSDVCGYSELVDKRGDVRGRTLLIKHNRMVMPLIEKYRGRVAEVVGDAVMASFAEPADGVRAAVEIQEKLADHNARKPETEHIHIKIGMNTGEALVDEEAAYQSLTGEVAIVAYRIQGQAAPDEILISRNLYARLRNCEDFRCAFHGSVRIKGKAEPQDLYRVIWRDEELPGDEAPQMRVMHAASGTSGRDIPRILHVEANFVGEKLRLSLHESVKGEALTIRNYEDITVPMDVIDLRCSELVEVLNKTNQRGCITRDVLMKLRDIGQIIYDDMFSVSIKERLKNCKAEYLCLNLDERLIHIPWELLHNGDQFLCRQFAMGRIVKTRQALPGNWGRELGRPLNVLVLADPTGDLKGAYAEGVEIRDYLDHFMESFNVAFRSDHIRADWLRQKMRNFDIVHFAGHADYHKENPDESGWRLSEGNLKAGDIRKMAGTSPMPALIFSNSCQSARTDGRALANGFQDDIFGMANAFLLSGVKHYVGTFWEIVDEPSRRFALEFYKAVVGGSPIGEAVRQARTSLINKYGEETIVWGSYLLYGDPTFNYMSQISRKESAAEFRAGRHFETSSSVRTGEDVIDFGKPPQIKQPRRWLVPAVLAALAGIMILWGYPGLLRQGPSEFESVALAHFEDGQYSDAVDACRTLQEKFPDRALSYLIMGNIQFDDGHPDQAKPYYQLAVSARNGTEMEKAQALIGLGRIASLEGDPRQALEFYGQASDLVPGDSQAAIAQAIILAEEGRYDAALELLQNSSAADAETPGLAALVYDIRQRAELAANREQQARIDGLVTDLLVHYKNSSVQGAVDDWTSTPLTVWLMDFRSEGYSAYEGEGRIIRSVIGARLIENKRVRLVERALIDKLLQELKIGTSKLTDRRTALALGKILAAKVIASGQIIHQRNQARISLRLIDTETGEVRAAVDRVFRRRASATGPSKEVADDAVGKLLELYPLRGKIIEINEGRAQLNIGREHGVLVDQAFSVVGTDILLKIDEVGSESSMAGIPDGELVPASGQRVQLYTNGDERD